MANGFYQRTLTKMLDPVVQIPISAIAVAPGGSSATITVASTSGGHGLAAAESVFLAGVAGNNNIGNLNGLRTVATRTSEFIFTISGAGLGLDDNGLSISALGTLTLVTSTQLGRYGGIVRWTADDIRAVFVDTASYTADLDDHDYLDDIAVGARIDEGSLAGKASSISVGGIYYGGVADANDITITTVGPGGTTVEAVVLYKWTGDATTSPLILYLDTATGLSFTANGGDVTISWDNGLNRIFRI